VTLPHLEYWIMAQLILEVALIFVLVMFLIKLRAMSRRLQEAEDHAVGAGGAKMAEALARLEENRQALAQRLTVLEEKLLSRGDRQASLAGPGRGAGPEPGSQGPSLRAQVEDLHLRGLSVGEIAKQLGLHPTEVKMALDLTRLSAELP